VDIGHNAIHEAAHCAIARHCEIELVTVKVSTAGGLTRFAKEIEDPKVEVLVRLAGEAAEILAYGFSDDPLASRNDRACADLAAFEAECGDLDASTILLTESRSAVRDLLFDRWNDVEAVAIALLRSADGTLSGAEVDAAIARGPLADDLAAARQASLSVCRPLANLADGEQ
jgi:hypothetical protein